MSTIWIVLSIALLLFVDGFVMTSKVRPKVKLWYVLSVMLVLLTGAVLSK